MTCFRVWSISQREEKGDKIVMHQNQVLRHDMGGWEKQEQDNHTNFVLMGTREKRGIIKIVCLTLVLQSWEDLKTILHHVNTLAHLYVFFVAFKSWTRQNASIYRVLVNRHFSAWDPSSTCSHRRWFRVKRELAVYVVRPSRGSHVWAGTEPSPSSRSPAGCPCGLAEGRRLDRAYLCESACHWWHVPFTKLKWWGYYCNSVDLYILKCISEVCFF